MIGCKWIFSVKRGEPGNVTRYKACLASQDFRQQYDVDYWETYSPVTSLNSVRTHLAVCCQLGFKVNQYDIETAYLNGELDEVVLMETPAGIKVDSDMMCRLRKCIRAQAVCCSLAQDNRGGVRELRYSGVLFRSVPLRQADRSLTDIHRAVCRRSARRVQE